MGDCSPTSAPKPVSTATMKQKNKSGTKSSDWNACWNNSLKEIGCLLPISGTPSSKGLTKKEIMIHMLQYFDFLQSHIQNLKSSLPPHCLPEISDRESESEGEDTLHSEPCTPPHLLKAKRKYSCTRSRKKTRVNPEPSGDNIHKGDADGNFTANTEQEYHPLRSADKSIYLTDESDINTQPDSSDSNRFSEILPATSSSRTGSSADQVSPCQGPESCCSICEDRTGSEDGSLGSKDLDTPPSGSFLLKDRMLGIFPSMGKKQLTFSPTFPETSVLPLLSLMGTGEGLNLSPSLFTSPARGLSHPLLPNGQEELQTLFEEVWVTPKTTVLNGPSFPSKFPNDSSEEDKYSDDINWAPKQHIPRRTARKAHHRKFFNKCMIETNPNLKKKCVNGFIMFCRMNRRLYLRTHPGTPSTVVTKELASLWHIMPKQERRLYCLKARSFSRQQNRNVRSEGQEAEREAEDCIPSPLHMLLAHRDQFIASSGKL